MKFKIMMAAMVLLAACGTGLVWYSARDGRDVDAGGTEASAESGKRRNAKTPSARRGGRARGKEPGAQGAPGGETAQAETPPQFAELERKRAEFRKKGIELLDFEDPDAPFSNEERALAKQLAEAAERKDTAATVSLASRALRSARPEIRSRAVRELGWVGKEALPELALALGDEDESVAADALMQFEQAIASIDDNREMAETVRLAMLAIKDKESLEAVSLHLHELEPGAAVSVIADVVAGGGDAAAVAKDTYKFISGEEWTDDAAAREWSVRRKAEMEATISPEEIAAAKAAQAAESAGKESAVRAATPDSAAPQRPDPGM